MKKTILILISLVLIINLVDATEWWDTSWDYRRTITLENIENIDRVDDTIILSDLSYFSEAQPDYKDLRVVENGNEIAYELFDSNTKLRFVTNIPANSIKEIEVYYGNELAIVPDYSDCGLWQPCTPLFEYTGLVAWYSFDDDNALDYSGNNHGTLNGPPIFTNGRIGRAYDIIQAFQYINVPTLDYGNNFSVEMWLKTNDLTTHYNYAYGTEGYLAMYLTYDRAAFWRVGPSAAVSTPGSYVDLNTWYHLAGTSNLSEIRLFFDNVDMGSYSASINIPSISTTIGTFIPGGNDPQRMYGAIDEVKIWDHARDSFPQEELSLETSQEERNPNNPDLAVFPEDIMFSEDSPLKNTTITITTLFHNLNLNDPEQVRVRFYSGEPSNETFIGEDIVEIAKSTFIAQTDWTPQIEGDYLIHIYIDPLDEIFEANESNNIAFKTLNVKTKPDLRVRAEDIFFSNNHPNHGDVIDVMVMIRNIESEPAENFTVKFYDETYNHLIGTTTMSIGGLQTEVATIPWRVWVGNHTLNVFADSSNIMEEWNEDNNEANKTISVGRKVVAIPIRYNMTNLP